MLKIGIVYHSGFGHTERVAQHVQQGANSVDSISADLFSVKNIMNDIEQLNPYHALIFGSPTYMGSVSAEFKQFMDLSSKLWFTQVWRDKLAAGFTNSGGLSGDKFNTLVQLATFAAQHGMLWVSLGTDIITDQKKPSGHPDNINRLGSFLGAMTQSDNLPPDQTPPIGDLKTAEFLGKRVAIATSRWYKQEAHKD